jgi:hypothetical protein
MAAMVQSMAMISSVYPEISGLLSIQNEEQENLKLWIEKLI